MNIQNIENNIFLKIPLKEVWREDRIEDFEASLGLEYYDEEFDCYYYKLLDKNKFILGMILYNITFEPTVILNFD